MAQLGFRQIWDLRTGGVFETLKYDHPVTGLQFDSRKIVAATGENGVKVHLFLLVVPVLSEFTRVSLIYTDL